MKDCVIMHFSYTAGSAYRSGSGIPSSITVHRAETNARLAVARENFPIEFSFSLDLVEDHATFHKALNDQIEVVNALLTGLFADGRNLDLEVSLWKFYTKLQDI